MKRDDIIWIIYFLVILLVFFSCSPRNYPAKPTQERHRKELPLFQIHVVGMLWVGVIYHFTDNDQR